LFIKKYDENSFKNLNNNQKVAFIAMVFETSVVDLITILADKGPEVFKLYLYANLSKSTLANAAIRITKFAEKMNEELTNKDNNPKP
jgi:putative heme iron utilization protein